ncbi:MAG: tRNA (adenosine(37)-N6)-threonylcarbamoyltransferase complex ATPase subunit type 1 TsaE [Candidatus Eremiobacteraeota bacterium]|nr:tRNA (adenosine(37)-N6)-threonylcarbamoyltransferase complex ATPase subunit type 1 TsaE [Candidatus Eremiobacteraeota bacterium]
MSSSRKYTLEAFPARHVVSSPAATQSLARALAAHLRPGDVVAVEGGLGSGKTTFVRGLATALLGTDPVSSPTFTFRHRYGGTEGSPALEHVDLYRIDDPAELAELGLEEAFATDAVTAIEWPERAPELVGRPRWRVVVDGSGEEPRAITIERLD